jgi:hypothetical protein
MIRELLILSGIVFIIGLINYFRHFKKVNHMIHAAIAAYEDKEEAQKTLEKIKTQGVEYEKK